MSEGWNQFMKKYNPSKPEINKPISNPYIKRPDFVTSYSEDTLNLIKEKYSSHKRKFDEVRKESFERLSGFSPKIYKKDFILESSNHLHTKPKRPRMDFDASGEVSSEFSKQEDTYKFLKAKRVMKELKELCNSDSENISFSIPEIQNKEIPGSRFGNGTYSLAADIKKDFFKPLYSNLREKILLIHKAKPFDENVFMETFKPSKRKAFETALLSAYRDTLSRY